MTDNKGNSIDIDAHLKRAFDQIENEALPDKLLGLLDKLRAEDAESAGSNESEDATAEDGHNG